MEICERGSSAIRQNGEEAQRIQKAVRKAFLPVFPLDTPAAQSVIKPLCTKQVVSVYLHKTMCVPEYSDAMTSRCHSMIELVKKEAC